MDNIDRLMTDMVARRAEAELLPEPLRAFVYQLLLNTQEARLKELRKADRGES